MPDRISLGAWTARNQMSAFATQESEFEEGLIVRRLPLTYLDGCCFALAADWLGDKVRGSGSGQYFRGLTRRVGRSTVRYPGGALSTNMSHWANLMHQVVPMQRMYSESSGNKDRVYRVNRLAESSSAPIHFQVATHRNQINDTAEIDPVLTIERIANSLTKGEGAMVHCCVGPYGHTTALYQSQAGRLHFFDSDNGVWQIHNAGRFFETWAQFWDAEGLSLSLDSDCVDFLNAA